MRKSNIGGGDDLAQKVAEKVNKVRRLLYVRPGKVCSQIDVFIIPKGLDDIRLVYNMTSCGLNKVMWAPWFALPGIRSHLRSVEVNTFLGDMDMGDMFHNYILHPLLQSHGRGRLCRLSICGRELGAFNASYWECRGKIMERVSYGDRKRLI